MIGIISPNLASVVEWRNRTKVPLAISPWLMGVIDTTGLRFRSIICLQEWESRPVNIEILRAARVLLFPVSSEDNEAAVLAPGTANNDINPDNTPPSYPALDRREMIEAGWPPILIDLLTPLERDHAMGLIRAPGNRMPAVRHYIGAMYTRYLDDGGNATVLRRRRENRINEVAAFFGEAERGTLDTLNDAMLETLARHVQEIELTTRSGDGGLSPDAIRRIREAYRRVLTDTMDDRPRPIPSRPPTSGPPTGGRALPFADIFRDAFRRPARDD